MREKYSRGEFEARNRQLPADLDQQGAHAANARARSEFEQTPVGAPPVCYDVRSVFDSRPVNTYDFTITQSGAFNSESTKVIEMTVPEGYVAVLRTMDVWFETTNPTGADRSAVRLDAFLNGGGVPDNEGIRIGVDSGPVPFFFIANEFDRIGARLRLSQGDYIGTAYVEFHGNFILKTGRPPVFEIANAVQSAQCAPVRTPSAPRLPAPPAPVSTALPAPIAPPPSAVRGSTIPSGHSTPTFKVNWRAQGMGNNAMLIPMQNDVGQRRDLSPNEVRQYLPFLQTQKFSRKEHEMFTAFLNSIGVRS